MNTKEYRKSIVSKYSDKKEGILMYKHQKYFAISSLIKKVVDIGLSESMNTEEYRKEVNQLLKDMPSEYQEEYGFYYQDFVNIYKESQREAKAYNETLATRLVKTLVRFDIYSKKSLLESATRQKHSLKNSDITITQHGSTLIMKVPQSYRLQQEGYSETGGEFRQYMHGYFKKKYFLYMPDMAKENIIDHEYQHFLNEILIQENHYIDYRLKNEFLAQLKGKADKIEIIYALISNSSYLSRYMLKSGHRVIIKLSPSKEEKSETFNDELYIDILQEKGGGRDHIETNTKLHNRLTPAPKEVKDTIMKKIELIFFMMKIYSNLKKICVPRYYDEDQFIYLLAFTPLSQRETVFNTYQQIQTLNETKGDLSSILGQTE